MTPEGSTMARDEGRLKTELTASWDAGAHRYDEAPRHGLRHDDEWVAWRRLVAAVLGDPSHAGVPRRRVLDVGTGTGVLALLAAELGHDVVGVDLSEGMLREARRKAADAGLAVALQVADAETLFPELRGFDVVICRHLVWTLPDPARAVAAWRAAANPGGLVAVIDGVYRRRRWPLSWAVRTAGALVAGQERRRGGHGHDYRHDAYQRLPLARQRDTRPIAALLRGAGLEGVRVRTLPEVDRVERAHLGSLERFADQWHRYLATGRVPAATSGDDPAAR